MTYNEWRDELYNNLLSVPDSERRRVLDYYAEAYADRREAGFTERQIINDFGAPYDAAQRILYENDGESYSNVHNSSQYGDSRRPYETQPQQNYQYEQQQQYQTQSQAQSQPQAQPQGEAKATARKDYTWVFVLLCIIFAGPLFGLIMSMVGITIGLCVAPFATLASGIFTVFSGIGLAYTNVSAGFVQIGIGLIETGVGLVLIPLFIWLVKMMWKLFRKLFAWIKSLFSGKENAQ